MGQDASGDTGHVHPPDGMLSAVLELEVIRPDYPARLGCVGGIVAGDFVDLAPERDGDPQEELHDAIKRAARHGDVALIVRIRNSRPPPSETREHTMEHLRALGPSLRCCIISLEDAGLRAIAFRSFVSAARLLKWLDVPIEVTTSLPESLACLEKHADFEPETVAMAKRFLEQGDLAAQE